MSSKSLAVILYSYDASPFGNKLKNLLTLKKVPYLSVDVSMTMPRPDLSERMGVNYRRIPILAIGNDVYCDSSLIASVLERRFPPCAGHPSLFPPRKGSSKSDTGMIKAFAMSYADRTLFPLAAENLPYGKFPADFVKDRSAWLGATIDPKAMAERSPVTKSYVVSHLALLEEQLADGREWLMDTEIPSLADASVHFIWAWLQEFRSLRELFDRSKFPHSVAWISHMSEYLAQIRTHQKLALDKISGEKAADTIVSSPGEDISVVGFDAAETKRLGLQSDQYVTVAPTDNGKYAVTTGKLLSLNREEIAIETKGSHGTVRCHFPRLNFSVKVAGQSDTAKL